MKGVFHSSAQIFVVVLATRSPSSLDIPHNELSGVVRSGLRGGHGSGVRDVGEPWPIQRPGKRSFKTSRTERAKCSGAPSCYSHMSCRSPVSLS